MAQLSHLEIVLEFEPVVKLTCENTDCKFNLANEYAAGMLACNLKRVTINDKGCCQNFEPYHRKEVE